MWKDILLVALGLVPALLVLAITQYYLWEKSKQYFLINKYEDARKRIYSDLQIILRYSNVLKNSLEHWGENPDDAYIRKNLETQFTNYQSDMKTMLTDTNNVYIIISYDESLYDIVNFYIESKNNFLSKMEQSYIELVNGDIPEVELEEIENKYSDLVTKFNVILDAKIKRTFQNPISRPLSWICSNIKRPST